MRSHLSPTARRLLAYYGTGAATTFVAGAVYWTIAEAVTPGQQYPDPFLSMASLATLGGPVGVAVALLAWAARDTWQVNLRPMWRRWVNHRWLVGEARSQGVIRPRYHCYVVPCGKTIRTFQRILTGRCGKHRWPR